MLRNTRKGFTLIELLIVVVIIGILAAIAIPKFANTKDKAKVSGMKTDLRNLVSAQEGHFADYAVYATATTANAAGRNATTMVFVPSTRNTVAITSAATNAGWSATVTRTDLATTTTCGVYVGSEPTPNAAVTSEGAVGCW